ncbi:hypothetical protein EDB89DRAFT_2083458 [Lactarius sanguifluus]|nr:hypothetical protein EDB89DRAFT_2083458 [Lactarius sanguifluus]
MLWTQFALSIVMTLFGTTSKAPRPLKLNIVFYGITAVASSCIAAAGIALHWQLTFVEQYLFLQALVVWASYRLMTVIHKILPSKDRESTDEKQGNDIPCNLDRKAFNPDGENIEMAGILRKPERIYRLRRPGRPAPIASLSSDHAGAMFATDSSEYVFCDLFSHFGHDMKELSTTLPTRLWRALPHRRARARASHENEPTENSEANGSIKSLDCSNVEAKYKDDTFDTESLDQASMYVFPPSSLSIILSNESDTEAAHRLPVLEKHDPTWAPRNPPSTSLIVSMPMSKDKSDRVARFDALKHEVDQASRTIVSRHVEESDRRLREEWLAKRTPMPMPMPIVITNVGGGSGARVAEKKSLATLPVLPESSSDCEDGLEGNDATEEDVTGDLFTKLE